MSILIILIVVGLVTFLQRVIYQKYWARALTASARFEDHYLTAGNETVITEVMSNAKFLPLPWVHLKFEILRNGRTDELFRSDIFNILFNQRITRRSSIRFDKRGVYQINSLDLVSYDLLITRKFAKQMPNFSQVTVLPGVIPDKDTETPYFKLMGELATRRFSTEDPFLFKGIREYRPGDPLKSINFKASARASSSEETWLVNTHEYTIDQSVRIILLTDKATNLYDETLYERSLSFASTLAGRLSQDDVPVSFMSNGVDSVENHMPAILSGTSDNHVDTIREAMARLDLTQTARPAAEIMEEIASQADPQTFYVLISPNYSQSMLEAYQKLSSCTTACQFICPIRNMDVVHLPSELKDLENKLDGFYFYSF